ncbi:alpha/beta hydrolase [Sphingomonas metalli]|uniref:Alpha/beta hydrolase n=1 Tax=Sphingomonas metalli TaxID=1779358 RepID=A0A916T7X3_9SPHN|nr:alpha/beta hydrolase [Sphingomonas metalli]
MHWWSNDGVRLHARDYPGDPGAVPLLCVPGLTRNARDYAAFAERWSGARRVIAVDLRGRGESGYAKDAMSYVPLTYVQDLEALLAEQGIGRFAMIGTSLGGIVTMLLARPARGRLAGALINDVGPEIEAGGLSRIRGYVGKASSWPTWLHAARAVEEANRDVYPDWGLQDWLAMAKRLYRVNTAGRVVLDYDMRIAEPFRVPGAETGPDMWSALAGLSGVPVAVVRGERSDLLGEKTAQRMMAALPEAELVTVPRVGHAPTLAEPEAEAAVGRLLDRIDRG